MAVNFKRQMSDACVCFVSCGKLSQMLIWISDVCPMTCLHIQQKLSPVKKCMPVAGLVCFSHGNARHASCNKQSCNVRHCCSIVNAVRQYCVNMYGNKHDISPRTVRQFKGKDHNVLYTMVRHRGRDGAFLVVAQHNTSARPNAHHCLHRSCSSFGLWMHNLTRNSTQTRSKNSCRRHCKRRR